MDSEMAETTWGESRAAVEAVTEAWASIDGKLDPYRRERDEKIGLDDPTCTDHYEGYQAEAAEIIKRIRKRGFELHPALALNPPAAKSGDDDGEKVGQC